MRKGSAEVLVLAGAELAAQAVEACLHEAGHRIIAFVHSVEEATLAVEQRTRRSPEAEALRSDLILVDLERMQDPAQREAITAFLRRFDVPAVYVSRGAEAPAWLAHDEDQDPAHDEDHRPLVARLDTRELALAMALASCRRENARLRARQGGQVARDLELDESGRLRQQETRRLERRWGQLLSSIPTVLYTRRAGGDLGLTFVSKNVRTQLGYDVSELVTEPRFWRDRIHPDDAAGVLAWLTEVPEEEATVMEYRFRHRDGTYRWLLDTRRLVRDQEEGTEDIVGAWMDITERKHIEDALRRSEARYRAIIEDQTELICRFRPEGVLTFVNEAYCRYFDKQPEELIGHSFVPLIPEEDQAIADEVFASLSPENPVAYSEHRVIMPDGEIRWQAWTDRVILDEAGKIVEYQAVGTDITERKQAEERVLQLNAELAQRATDLQVTNAELESFSYSVSHDLRAPLRAIDGFSKAVVEDYASILDVRGRSYLQRLRQASQRMSRLIDDLLALSRMSRSAMHLETCDMSAMVHAIVRELRKSQPAREVDMDIESGMQVHADANLLRVVLDNLLGNAWKFTSRQPRARIQVGRTTRNGHTAYFVRDDGAGFDMAYVDKLFSPFQRLHGMHEFEGTGIGLATVRRIIRRHGGEIWAEGKAGEGATFTFTLS